MYTNALSLYNKLDELRVRILERKPHIVAITETWLTPAIIDSEIHIPGYQIFRRDREERNGGGILVYTVEKISAMKVASAPNIAGQLELLVLKLIVKSSPNLTVALVYRPPNQESLQDDLLIAELRRYCTQPEFIAIGDFNAPSVDWATCNTVHEAGFDRKLVDFTQDNFLVQNVHEPTRFRDGQQPNCLDLVFTRDDDSISEVKLFPPLGSSDHNILNWEYQLTDIPEDVVEYKRSVWKADINAMREHLHSTDWESTMVGPVEDSWSYFKSVILHLVETYCPLIPMKKRNRPAWLTSEIKTAIRKKSRAWSLYRSTGYSYHETEYKNMRNKCKEIIEKSRSTHDRHVLENSIDNPKQFYAFLNKKLKSRDQIPSLTALTGTSVSEDVGKAELFSDFFQSVYVNEPQHEYENFNQPASAVMLEDVHIDIVQVKRELLGLNASKSAGPDQIPAKLLKDLAVELCIPLTKVFNQSLECSSLPADWKKGNISPIFKGGSKHSPNCYRPISLTCICCKLMERIIKANMVEFLESNRLLSEVQFGFRQNRSCLTNILFSLEKWTKSLDEGLPVDVIYIDFQKAFDSVPHNRLLYKLKSYGFAGRLHKWIGDFLLGRTQSVRVNNASSNWQLVRSGVPQGSVLGPLLFLLYVDDIHTHLDCNIVMFADDLKIWLPIKSCDDERRLQYNLDSLQRWSETWLLKFNTSKCVYLNLSTSPVLTENKYALCNQPLAQVTVEKDLGVLISSTLKPFPQCLKSANTAMGVMRRIKRSFKYLAPDIFQKVYTTYVRPHLEYSVQAWRPWFVKDILLLSNVQRRSTKLVDGFTNISHTDREAMLNLFPLHYRQLRGDLLLTYKIVRGQNCCLNSEDFFTLSTTSHLRGHPWKLKKSRSRLLLRQNFFSQRVINPWNALPLHVVSSPNIDIFKLRMDAFYMQNNHVNVLNS
jgi:hypothetical protein